LEFKRIGISPPPLFYKIKYSGIELDALLCISTGGKNKKIQNQQNWNLEFKKIGISSSSLYFIKLNIGPLS
jgi:hypothetical protein